MKDLLRRIRVTVITISNKNIQRRRLADHVNKLPQKACRTCSTIVFSYSTNHIIDLGRCCCRCSLRFLNSLFLFFLSFYIGQCGRGTQKLGCRITWLSRTKLKTSKTQTQTQTYPRARTYKKTQHSRSYIWYLRILSTEKWNYILIILGTIKP